jgi:hypothetical protein
VCVDMDDHRTVFKKYLWAAKTTPSLSTVVATASPRSSHGTSVPQEPVSQGYEVSSTQHSSAGENR